jgi:hypothetical protein
MTGEAPAAGTLATEVALLLDAVADRLTGLRPNPDGSGDHGADPARCPECGSIPGAACTACPVCRFLALIRGERPETAARLVDGALLIVRGVRALLPEPDGSVAPDAPAAPAMSPPNGSAAGRDRSAPVGVPHGGFERIDIQ